MSTQILGSIRGDVSLSTQKFQQGVSTINRQLQLVKSQFDASAAKARAFGKEEDRSRLQSQSLARQIDLQRQKVGLLARAHQEYAKRLGADASATQRLGVQLNRARAALASLEGTQRRVNSQMRQTSQLNQRTGQAMQQLEARTRLVQSQFQVAEARARAFGTAMDRLRVQQQGLAQNIELQRKRISLLSLEYKEAARSMGQHATATKQAAIRLNEARATLARMQGDLSRVNQRMAQQTSIMGRMGKGFSNVRGMAIDASVGIGIFGGALSMAAGSALRDSMEFEQAFAGVRKTVDATEAEFAQLRDGIRRMAREMPQAHEEIARVGEAAGQLGIQKDHILGFTRTMVDMGVATNMSSDDAAKALARLANITQMSQRDFDRLGSTVVALGNNLATTESEIVEMGLRIAGAGHQVGMTEAQILSFAGALSSVGIKVEAGGTAISRVFLEMGTAVDAGGKKLDTFARVAGMSASDFRKAFKEDAADAVLTFIEGLGKMQKSGKNVVPTLKELSLNEIRVRDSLLRAAGAGDLFRKSIDLGTKAWKENNALTKEAQERYKTAASQMQIARNKIRDIKITMADALMPVLLRALNALDPMIDGIAKLAKGFESLDNSTKDAIVTFAGVTGGLMILGGALAGLIALLGGPATAALVGGSLALGLFSAGAVKASKDMKKTEEDAIRFGHGVSEGTKKAARGFLDLRDQAQANLLKLRTATGKEAQKIVDETVAIFAQMGDKIVSALNKDKVNIQKATAALLGEVPDELKPLVEGIGDSAVRAIESQIKRIQEANEVISEGIVKYSGDISKMPKAFAEAYNQALKDTDQGARVFAQKISDAQTLMDKLQSQQGKVSAKAALKFQKDIEGAYKEAVKAAERSSKEQRKIWNDAYKDGQISKEARDAILKVVEEVEQQRIDIAETKRAEGLQILRDSLSEEAMLYDAQTGEIIKSQSKLLGDLEELNKKRGSEAWDAYFEEGIAKGEEAQKALKSRFKGLIEEYGDIGTQSIEAYTASLKKGGEEAYLAAYFVATETRDGFQIDLGPEGMISVGSFIKGLQSGEYGAREVAIAHMNMLRNVYGSGSFTPEGIKAVETFAEGLKSQKPQEVADQLGLDLKSKMKIDLGRYGEMTAESFAQGLSDGTLGFDAVYAFFRTQIQNGMTVDLSKEGKQNIETLRLGMETGAIDTEEAAAALGLNIKSKVKVDLGPAGKHNVQTLLAGLQSGEVSIEQFAQGIEGLLKEGTKTDLKPQGKAAGDSMAQGLNESKPNIASEALSVQVATERLLGKTTDGGGGKKAGSQFADGVGGQKTNAQKQAASVAGGAKSNLKVSGAHGIGRNMGVGFARGISSGRSSAINAAIDLARSALNAAKKALGIRSPSRVMMAVGGFYGDGLVLGMKKKLPEVESQAKQMAQAAIAGVGTAANLAKAFSRSGGALGKYLRAVLQDGDYLNDWLTHLPKEMRKVVQTIGELSTKDLFPDVYARAKTKITSSTPSGGTTVNKYYTINVGAGAQNVAQEVVRALCNWEALEGR